LYAVLNFGFLVKTKPRIGGFVTITAAPISTGRSDPVPGRVFIPAGGPLPFHGAPKHPDLPSSSLGLSNLYSFSLGAYGSDS
jgi:hypothetical protein